MHLRNVEIFCDVVTRRSFSKAAEANSVSQSAASQAVHMLEERIGTQLIDRSKRPLELTAAGQLYFDGCRKLLDRFREIEDRIQRLEDRVVGRLRIAAIYSVGLLEMDAFVRRYRALYPEVDLVVEYLHPDEVYDRVVNDDADLGLLSFPRDGREIACIPWQKQPMVLVVSPEHRWAGRRQLSIQSLQGEDFVGFCRQLTIRRRIDRWLRQQRVTVNVVHEFDNIENIKRAVEIGSGVAILPRSTVCREEEAGSLRAVAFQDIEWARPLGIIHKRHRTLTTPATKFIEILQQSPETGGCHETVESVAAGNGKLKKECHSIPSRRTKTKSQMKAKTIGRETR